MRQLTAGDIEGKLARIEHREGRSRRWKKRAKAKLIKDVQARHIPGTKHLVLPNGDRVCAKRRFPTFTAALHALLTAWESPNPNRNETRVYACPHCAAWHITSRPYEEDHNGREASTEGSSQDRQGEGRRHRHPCEGRE